MSLPSSRARDQVWGDLKAVAVPDSRFHLRFNEFIPDFQGSAAAIDRLCALPAAQGVRHVFVTPDSSLTELRRRWLADGVGLVVSSYNMARGFLWLKPGSVPPGHELYASWLDGLEHFGQRLDLAGLAALGRFDCVATGASAVATSGVRFGRGHGYLDLEWRLFSELGLVGERTPVLTAVHDVQVLDKALFPSPDDLLVDAICTPTRTLTVERTTPRPRGMRWDEVTPEQLDTMPALAELHRAVGLG